MQAGYTQYTDESAIDMMRDGGRRTMDWEMDKPNWWPKVTTKGKCTVVVGRLHRWHSGTDSDNVPSFPSQHIGATHASLYIPDV